MEDNITTNGVERNLTMANVRPSLTTHGIDALRL